MRWFLKILKYLFAFLVLLIICTSAWHWYASQTDGKKFPAPGELLIVNGKSMHLHCLGEGSPALILEAGLMSGSTSWFKVHESLASVTRTCAYDRPGIDWSEPGSGSNSAREVAANLHALLQSAGVDRPLILVGMSAGGVYVREFQRQWPEQVIGMAFIDSSHEQQGHRLPTLDVDNPLPMMLKLCSVLAPTGVLRTFSVFEGVLEGMGVTMADKQQTLALMNRNHTCEAIQRESAGFAADLLPNDPPVSLGDLPLLVLSQGAEPSLDDMPPGYTIEFARDLRVVWNELQLELTALSSRGRRVVATESGHIIQSDQPELVITELSRFVEEIRLMASD